MTFASTSQLNIEYDVHRLEHPLFKLKISNSDKEYRLTSNNFEVQMRKIVKRRMFGPALTFLFENDTIG